MLQGTKIKPISKTAFKRLSKVDQRKLLIRDALTQIKVGKFKVDTGRYVTIHDLPDRPGAELKDLLPTLQECHVCAKGALFLEHVSKFNDCKLNRWGGLDNDGSDDIQQRLKDIFSSEQLNLIETAFEKKVIIDEENIIKKGRKYTPLGRRAVDFGRQYKKPKERLEAIFKKMLRTKECIFKP